MKKAVDIFFSTSLIFFDSIFPFDLQNINIGQMLHSGLLALQTILAKSIKDWQ